MPELLALRPAQSRPPRTDRGSPAREPRGCSARTRIASQTPPGKRRHPLLIARLVVARRIPRRRVARRLSRRRAIVCCLRRHVLVRRRRESVVRRTARRRAIVCCLRRHCIGPGSAGRARNPPQKPLPEIGWRQPAESRQILGRNGHVRGQVQRQQCGSVRELGDEFRLRLCAGPRLCARRTVPSRRAAQMLDRWPCRVGMAYHGRPRCIPRSQVRWGNVERTRLSSREKWSLCSLSESAARCVPVGVMRGPDSHGRPAPA
ncbi:hypothetical protein EDD30_5468 [Couchioplanes caeruleus]|uniref:Uncharacterized protein n=1 Tax=Couchioplanes caeruleus TaxID=56438 RepID=A0A3N1GQI9_9ACTN|nr:hypothetical protein EDD30_5468 [Couchioplanes caeruleus]